jgi:hypothetical protein
MRKTRTDLELHPPFRAELTHQKELVTAMEFRVVAIEDGFESYVFEAYAARRTDRCAFPRHIMGETRPSIGRDGPELASRLSSAPPGGEVGSPVEVESGETARSRGARSEPRGGGAPSIG